TTRPTWRSAGRSWARPPTSRTGSNTSRWPSNQYTVDSTQYTVHRQSHSPSQPSPAGREDPADWKIFPALGAGLGWGSVRSVYGVRYTGSGYGNQRSDHVARTQQGFM